MSTDKKNKRPGRRKYSLDYALNRFEKNDLVIITPEALDIVEGKLTTFEKIKCKCNKCGKLFATTLAHVNEGKSCKGCGYKNTADKLKKRKEDYIKLADFYGGQLVEKGGRITNLSKWICKHGHEFEKSYTHITQNGIFCSKCSGSHAAEFVLKEITELLLHRKFKSKRFKEMRGLGGGALEIDIFNRNLKLGIEHHGIQHYEPVPFWDPEGDGTKPLKKLQEHDKTVRKFCEEYAITLVEVRQLDEHTTREQYRQLLHEKCVAAKIEIPPDFFSIDITKVKYEGKGAETWADTLRKAQERGLSPAPGEVYNGWTTKVKWICQHGHSVPISPKKIKVGRGCSDCNKTPLILSNGLIFKSVTECAKKFHTEVADVHATATRCGNFRGYGVKLITHEQFKLFKRNPVETEKFCTLQFGCFGPKEKTAVIFSDGRIFEKPLDAAQVLGLKSSDIGVLAKKHRNYQEYGIDRIEYLDWKEMQDNPEVAKAYCLRRWGKIGKLGKTPRKGVLLSSGEMFNSLKDAADYLGMRPSTLSPFVNRGYLEDGRKIFICSQEEFWLLKHNESKRSSFLELKSST